MAEGYWLGGSTWAATRLQAQHELTKKLFQYQILDPIISIPKPGMLVSDVATGTGTWALDLAEMVPDTVQIEGLDVNLSELPPKSWMPSNVTFRKFDLTKDVPDESIERYDIVHVQYVMIFVLDANFPHVLERLIKVLKPGGYIQWTDTNSYAYSFRTSNGDNEAPEASKLYDMTKAFLQVDSPAGSRYWMNDLSSAFSSAGLKVVKPQQYAEPGPSSLQSLLMMWIWALTEGFAAVAEKNEKVKAWFDGWLAQREKVVNEARQLGTGMDMKMFRCVGRKPEK